MNRFYRAITTTLTVAIICTILGITPVFSKDTLHKNKITITVRSSHNASLFSRLDIDSPEVSQALIKAKEEKVSSAFFLTDVYVTVLQGAKETHFRLEQSGNLWKESELKRLVLPRKVSDKLLDAAKALRKRHYGKLIPWEDAKHLITRKSIFSITDLETGLTFQVQRRAGDAHADVQPLTKEDTKIMKQIYNGRWSWNRKAILVHSGHQWMAASMNGMPHGRDGIPGNGFSGHFCVHFYRSTTHRANHPDLAHQLMVHKAAGDLKSFFAAASPLVLAESFIEAMNHQDAEILRQVSEGIAKEKLGHFVQEMGAISSIRIIKERGSDKSYHKSDTGSDEKFFEELKLPIAIDKNGGSKRATVYRFIFSKVAGQSQWRIEDILLANKKQDSGKKTRF